MSVTLSVICTNRVPLDAVNGSSMKRWSMLTLWVTDPVFTNVSRRMSAAPTPIEKSTPISSVSGAVAIVGRGAKLPGAL